LENFADGDVTKTVHFRDYDPLRNIANSFNNSLKEFAQMLRAIEQANNNMNKAREKLDGTVKSIDKFKESVVAVEKEIEKFKT
jgi:methyl-accepting chemotaxis protein